MRSREQDRQQWQDPDFNKWLDDAISDAGHTVWDAIPDIGSAWNGWDASKAALGFYCPACNGSGEEWTLSDSTPDAHYVQATCGECSGSGTMQGAYQTAKLQRDSYAERLTEAGGKLLFMRADHDRLEAENAGLKRYADRYRWIRHRNLDTISQGGVFAGITPQNLVINEETLDEAIDAAMAKERGQ
ncbi:hypothetical protein KNHN1_17610 [Pseudomonas guariconensis]|uniref:hypothetical protein n=1 Tax=Pseudomonas guariconensis TaxID=1288410 RepID=UPI0036F35109